MLSVSTPKETAASKACGGYRWELLELCPGHLKWPRSSALTELVFQIETESSDLVGAESVTVVGGSLTPARRL